MKRFLLLFAAMLACALPVAAQTVTVSATNVHDIFGNKLASGQACFLPTDNSGNPMSYKDGGGGQAEGVRKCVSVTNGAFSATLSDTSLTNPANVCYQTTVKDTSNGTTPIRGGYECVQPTASNSWCTAGVCNFDNYVPATVPNVVQVAGPTGPTGPTGPQGIAGTTTATGSSGGFTVPGLFTALGGASVASSSVGIACAGDSRMAGNTLLAGQDLCTQIAAQPRFANAAFVHNGAVGGATCSSMTSVYATNVQPYKPAGAVTKVYLFILDGINDFLSGGLVASQVQSCKQSYLAQAVADGFTPILLTSYYSSAATDAQETERIKYNNWTRSLPYTVIDIDRMFPSAADNPYYGLNRGSASVTSYIVQPGVAILTFVKGASYTGSVTCTVSGGTFTSPATCSGTIVNGTIIPFITDPGVYSDATGLTITVSATGGSGASVTPWLTQVARLTGSNTFDMGTATATNYGVYLNGFPTSTWLNGLTSSATPNGLPLVYANATNFGLVISHATTGTVAESGTAELVGIDQTHLGPAGVLLEAKAVSNLFGVGTPTSYTPSQDRSYEAPLGGKKRINASLTVGAATSWTGFNPGDIMAARDNTTGVMALGADGGWWFLRQGNITTWTAPGTVNLTRGFTAGGSVGGSFTTGDLGASRSPTTGVLFLGTDGGGYVFRDTATDIQVPATFTFTAAGYKTATNCLSTAGTCGAASAGRVTIAAAATTVTVTTTAVTTASEIFVQEDSSLGAIFGITCNTTAGRTYTVTARTGGTSFTITSSGAPTTNAACLSYRIMN